MSEPTLAAPKSPVPDAADLDPAGAARLAHMYDNPWRNDGGRAVLIGAGVYGVWVDGSRTSRPKEFRWLGRDLSSRDVDTIELADGAVSSHPAIRVLLRGQAHDYWFYVAAETVQEAIDNFLAASVMCS